MSFEVNKHDMVPKHSKLSDAEKKNVLETLKIELRAFPKILKDDPALIKLNPKMGDLIKIERKSKTAGETIYYRAVSEK